MVINIPDDIKILELFDEDLPPNWNVKPLILETQFIGDDFVIDTPAAVLKVPSAIVDQEHNYLINPNHPDAKGIMVVSKSQLRFDLRLKQGIKK